MHTKGPVLIAYDGSEDSRFAIDEVASLLSGSQTVVLYARQPLESIAAHLQGHPVLEDVKTIDAASLDAAERTALDGADYANKAGLDAEARVVSTTESPADAIVQIADELDASLIVMGSRGRRGLQALLLGSTSHHVVHHARRPTLIVPSPPLAEVRRRAVTDRPTVSTSIAEPVGGR